MPTLTKFSWPSFADLNEPAQSLVLQQLDTAAVFLELAVRSRSLIADSYEVVTRVNATLYGDLHSGSTGRT